MQKRSEFSLHHVTIFPASCVVENMIDLEEIVESLPLSVNRIYQPRRAWVQFDCKRKKFKVVVRLIGILCTGNTSIYPGRGEEPTVTVNGNKVSFEDFENQFRIFRRHSGNFSWTGVTVASLNMNVEGRVSGGDHVTGPLSITFDWEHDGKMNKIVLKTSYGILM